MSFILFNFLLLWEKMDHRWIMDILYIVEATLNKFLGVETTGEVFLTSCFSFSAGCSDGLVQWRIICLN